MNVLITGVSGFVGAALCRELLARGISVRGVTRAGSPLPYLPAEITVYSVPSVDARTDWTQAVHGVDVVFHLAARVHVMNETAANPVGEFRKVNVDGTVRLAREAAASGVKRFIFLSTVGVYGNTTQGKPYTENDRPSPYNAYSLSKWEAGQQLEALGAECGMQIVQVQAPLVYGPGNPGNFLRLLRVIKKGIPLPLASIRNARSLIYIGNLVDALIVCGTHEQAKGRYIVRDGQNVSTPELIRRTAKALGVKARLFHFPVSLLAAAGLALRRSEAVNRLTGSLTVDSSRIVQELGWHPPVTLDQGLRETATWFNATLSKYREK
jgi:nucleoside-diphosphate-sugar epimerase